MNSKIKKAKRYTADQKAEIIQFMVDYKKENGRGAQKIAAEKYGVSAATLTNWMKSTKKKRGRKPGSKNKKTDQILQAITYQNPEDLRRLAELVEEIQELEEQVAKLEELKKEATELSAKLIG